MLIYNMKMKVYGYFFLLIVILFFPLFLGYNFLPFSKYGYYAKTIVKIEKGGYDDEFINRMKGFRNFEFFWFSISLPDDFYCSENFKKGKIPNYNPYSGCGYFNFSSGQFRPFNPFKIFFYLIPSVFTFSLSFFFLLIFGSLFLIKFLKLNGCSDAGVFLGTTFFSLNPFILDRIYQTDGSAYLLLPFVLYIIAKFDIKNSFKFSFLFSFSLFLLFSVSHPVVFVILTIFSFFYYLLKNGMKIKSILIIFFTIFLTLLYSLPYYLPFLVDFKNKISYKAIFYALYDFSFKSFFLPSSSLFFFPQVLILFFYSFFIRDGFNFCKLGSLLILLIFLGFRIFEPLIYFVERNLFIHIFYFLPLLFFMVSILVAKYFEPFLEETPVKRFFIFLALILNISLILIFHFEKNSPSKEYCSYPSILFSFFIIFSIFYLIYPFLKFSIKRKLIIILFVLPFIFPQPLDFLFWNRTNIVVPESVKYLKENHPFERVVSIGFNPGFVIPPNWGSYFKIRQGEINSAIFNSEFFKMFYNKKFPPTMIAYNFPEIMAFEQMGAKFLLTPKNCPKIDEKFFNGIKLIKEFDDSYLYELKNGKGRLFFAKKFAFKRDDYESLSKQILDFGKGEDGYVIVEYDDSLKDFLIEEGDGNQEIKILKDEVDELEIEVKSDKNGLLVIRDIFEDKFKAFVEGKEVKIYKVNGCFSGIKVEEGKSKITLKYSSNIEKFSIYLSLSSLLISSFIFFMLKFFIKNGED